MVVADAIHLFTKLPVYLTDFDAKKLGLPGSRFHHVERLHKKQERQTQRQLDEPEE